jgi:formamidopyrimidine-DNA glycosylase
MPEICEVNLTSQILLHYLKDQTISKIKILSGRYTKTDPEGFEEFKLPSKVIDIRTKGKFLWFEMSTGYILNTFGLEGMWSLEKQKHSRFQFVTKKGINVFFNDTRNFGTFKFCMDDEELNKKLDKLGIDVLQDTYTYKTIKNKCELLSSAMRKKTITEILMNQELVVCGLGNYLVPEILYRAKLSPHRKINSFTINDYKILCDKIKETVKMCYKNNKTGYMEYLKDFLDNKEIKFKKYLKDIQINEEFEFLVYRRKKDDNGNKIIADEIVKGRKLYWCPIVQK